MSHTESQIPEAQRIPDRINGKQERKEGRKRQKQADKNPTFRHIIVKLQKIKDK